MGREARDQGSDGGAGVCELKKPMADEDVECMGAREKREWRIRMLYEEYISLQPVRDTWFAPVTETPRIEPLFTAGMQGVELAFVLLAHFLNDSREYVVKRPRIEMVAKDIQTQLELLAEIVDGELEDEALLEESLGFSKPRDADDPEILEGASSHAEFLPANSWVGRVKGYAFFKGKCGLGYYIDKKIEASHETPIKYLINQCATKVLHELQQRCKVLSKTISADNQHFLEECPMDVVEARFQMTNKILDFVRLLRDRHTASATVRLKNSILNDIEIDVDALCKHLGLEF
jgi:hypothetical protein